MRFSRPIILTALAFAATVTGCSAQNSPAAMTPELKRRVEINLRQKYTNIPLEVQFEFGERKPSDISGYDLLPVTLSNGERRSTLEFLISRDNHSLARLEKVDISSTPDQKVSLAGRPVRGNPNAKVTIINFDDFQCPYCQRMHEQLVTDVLTTYGDKVKVVYKDYPLGIHPWAAHAAVNANCIAAQDAKAYWAYADWVHANLDDLNRNSKGEKRPLVEQTNKLDEGARAVAKQATLDGPRVEACLKKQDLTAVKSSIAEGEALQIDSTPTLFVNGERVNGAYPMEQFRPVLERALRAVGETVPVPPEPKSEPKPEPKPAPKSAAKPGPPKK